MKFTFLRHYSALAIYRNLLWSLFCICMLNALLGSGLSKSFLYPPFLRKSSNAFLAFLRNLKNDALALIRQFQIDAYRYYFIWNFSVLYLCNIKMSLHNESLIKCSFRKNESNESFKQLVIVQSLTSLKLIFPRTCNSLN